VVLALLVGARWGRRSIVGFELLVMNEGRGLNLFVELELSLQACMLQIVKRMANQCKKTKRRKENCCQLEDSNDVTAKHIGEKPSYYFI